MLLITLLLALAGCTCRSDANVRELTEVQTACLTGDGRVRVGFGGCIAPRCEQLVRSSCVAHVEDQQVVVKGSVALEHVGDACTEGCKPALATCEGEAIADATGLAVNAKITPKLTRCWDVH
jgi:hypothetical protein